MRNRSLVGSEEIADIMNKPKCNHKWRHAGGCQCPSEVGPQVRGYFCSRAVFECSKCGESDYGESREAVAECSKCPRSSMSASQYEKS